MYKEMLESKWKKSPIMSLVVIKLNRDIRAVITSGPYGLKCTRVHSSRRAMHFSPDILWMSLLHCNKHLLTV